MSTRRQDPFGHSGRRQYDFASMADPAPLPPQLVDTAHSARGLHLLMLFGSRARRDSHPGSDWDFAYIATAAFDPAAFLGNVATIVGTDRVDLVDLDRAGALIRYRVARDGQVVFEAQPGIADRFQFEAVRFWCDAESVLQRGYDQVLAELTR